MFKRLRQSLALWLAVQYALVFAASATILFGVLYWVLARALEERDQAIVDDAPRCSRVLTQMASSAEWSKDLAAVRCRMETRGSFA
jgi:hypothetical protein